VDPGPAVTPSLLFDAALGFLFRDGHLLPARSVDDHVLPTAWPSTKIWKSKGLYSTPLAMDSYRTSVERERRPDPEDIDASPQRLTRAGTLGVVVNALRNHRAR
jgi:hypothetical protein